MAKVLKIDTTAGTAYVSKAVPPAIAADFYFAFRFYVPAATLALYGVGGFIGDLAYFVPAAFFSDGINIYNDAGTWRWDGDNSPTDTGTLTADTWFDVEAHFVAAGGPANWTVEWKVGGVSLWTPYGVTGTHPIQTLQLGVVYFAASGGIFYFDDVKLGHGDWLVSGAGTVDWSDGFESGDLSAWDSTTGPGAATVVDAPSPGPPPSSPVLISEPPWRYVVADVVFNGSSPPGFSTLTFLDHRAINRQVRYYLRQAATAAGRVAADDPEVNILGLDSEPFLAEGVRMLIGLRREGGTPPWKVRFAGPILQASRLVENDVPWVDFTAYSVRQLLYKRPVRDGSGLLLSNKGLTFTGVKGNTILLALLNRTQVADGWHFLDTTTGTIEDTDPIDINFQQGSSVGEALDQLEQTGTMDVLLPAVYDPAGSPGILAQLNIHVLAGAVKHGAIMSWDMAGRTLAGINWLEDGQQRENHVELYTSAGLPTPVAADTDSDLKYGPYWGQQNYPVQTQLAALEAAALVRLLTQKDHPETIELSPLPQRAPIPFNEYFLADWLPTYASKRLGKSLNKSLRVYEVDLDLGDDYGETAHLLTSANLDPPTPPGLAVAITGGTNSGDTLTAEIIT